MSWKLQVAPSLWLMMLALALFMDTLYLFKVICLRILPWDLSPFLNHHHLFARKIWGRFFSKHRTSRANLRNRSWTISGMIQNPSGEPPSTRNPVNCNRWMKSFYQRLVPFSMQPETEQFSTDRGTGLSHLFLRKQHLRIKISSRKQQQTQKPTKYILSRELTYPTFGKRKLIFKIAVEMDMLVPWRVYTILEMCLPSILRLQSSKRIPINQNKNHLASRFLILQYYPPWN